MVPDVEVRGKRKFKAAALVAPSSAVVAVSFMGLERTLEEVAVDEPDHSLEAASNFGEILDSLERSTTSFALLLHHVGSTE